MQRWETRPDYLKMVNNDAPLSDLLRTNCGTVSSGVTFSLSNSCYNLFWFAREDLDPAAVYQVRTVNWVQKLIGFDVAFTRSTGEFFDENRKEQAIRMYTVFESEMGDISTAFFQLLSRIPAEPLAFHSVPADPGGL